MSDPSPPGPLRVRLRHVPSGLIAAAVVGVVVGIAGWLLRGGAGATGALAGVALVTVSYVVSSAVIAWVDWRAPRLVLIAALATYIVKFAVFGMALAAVARTGWPGLAPMGVAIIVAALAWGTGQAWWTWRAKLPYVDDPAVLPYVDDPAGESPRGT